MWTRQTSSSSIIESSWRSIERTCRHHLWLTPLWSSKKPWTSTSSLKRWPPLFIKSQPCSLQSSWTGKATTSRATQTHFQTLVRGAWRSRHIWRSRTAPLMSSKLSHLPNQPKKGSYHHLQIALSLYTSNGRGCVEKRKISFYYQANDLYLRFSLRRATEEAKVPLLIMKEHLPINLLRLRKRKIERKKCT